jgi:hypothetical protein
MIFHTSFAGAAITRSTATGHLNPDCVSRITIYVYMLGQYKSGICFGSVADILPQIIPAAAATNQPFDYPFPENADLNVSSSRKR